GGRLMAETVLIVDDAAFMRMMIKDILTKNGYQVVGEAENGAVAVEKYKELTPDLVTMDITMPEKDGIEALKEIKEINSDAVLLCVQQWGSKQWLLMLFRLAQKILSLNRFKLTE